MRFAIFSLILALFAGGCTLELSSPQEDEQVPLPAGVLDNNMPTLVPSQPVLVAEELLPGYFCDTGREDWVSRGLVCDGVEDCANGADEAYLNCQDDDMDGYPARLDNCPHSFNLNQFDLDEDGWGDVCDDDMDGDGILNTDDKDIDGDSTENIWDPCPMQYADSSCEFGRLAWCYTEPTQEDLYGWAIHLGEGKGEWTLHTYIPFQAMGGGAKCAFITVPDEVGEVYIDAATADPGSMDFVHLGSTPALVLLSRDGWDIPAPADIGVYNTEMQGFTIRM